MNTTTVFSCPLLSQDEMDMLRRELAAHARSLNVATIAAAYEERFDDAIALQRRAVAIVDFMGRLV